MWVQLFHDHLLICSFLCAFECGVHECACSPQRTWLLSQALLYSVLAGHSLSLKVPDQQLQDPPRSCTHSIRVNRHTVVMPDILVGSGNLNSGPPSHVHSKCLSTANALLKPYMSGVRYQETVFLRYTLTAKQ